MEALEQLSLADESEEYRAFVEKFKPKKTTDDCYTPELVMDAVNRWTAAEYGLDPALFVRPFWPGADYQRADYSGGRIVVDNPPFSILAQICDWYLAREIPFLLFAPTLTSINWLAGDRINNMCVLLCGVQITYANGAGINTSFVTNMDREYCLRCVPDLYQMVDAANCENIRAQTRELPKYRYPDAVISGAAYQLAKHGQDYRVRRGEAVMVRRLDAQAPFGKAVFGGGLLLSERATAERAAAERAAAECAAAECAAVKVWELSDREKALQKSLGNV